MTAAGGRFGVYVHYPYCRQRCTYCDFAIRVRHELGATEHRRYLQAIEAELLARAGLFPGRRLVSIYFGGGTPSLWPAECVARAREQIQLRFPPANKIEVTLECDPADVSEDHLRALRAAGVNRISLGVQTLDDRQLLALNRQHNAAQAVRAVELCRRAGFDNLSIDLIVGLVGQTRAELGADLAGVLRLLPEHLSLYQLTVEPGTPLYAQIRRGRSARPDDDFQAAAYDQVRDTLGAAGYVHYEISNFARGGGRDLQAVHNRLYWTGGEYLGLGVGAHSYRRLAGGAGERFANGRSTEAYLRTFGSGDPAAWALHEVLEPAALAREALWLGLRQLQGLSRLSYQTEHGVDPVTLGGAALLRLRERGLVEWDDDLLRLSRTGALFADEVGAALL